MKIFHQQDWIPQMRLTLNGKLQIPKELGDPWTDSCVHTYRLNIVLELFLDVQYF